MRPLSLITRGDDAGSCRSANNSVLEAARDGILRNISVMACGPELAHAAEILCPLRHVAFGLHVTLNSEWDLIKWRPVLDCKRVPDLVDADGCFTSHPRILWRRQVDPDQMMAEVRAQLARARAHKIEISYLDEHMGVGWLPGLRARLTEFAHREGLIYDHGFTHLPSATVAPAGDLVSRLADRLASAGSGTFVFVTHPGSDAEDMRRMCDRRRPPGIIATTRDQERRLLLSRRLRKVLEERSVRLCRYTDVARAAATATIQHAI